MSDILIDEEPGNAEQGRYVARVAGIDAQAELTFKRLGPDLISADHTEAPETLRGTGAAGALVDRLVSDARQRGVKIVPQCPYVRSRFEKNPDWSDVMASDSAGAS